MKAHEMPKAFYWGKPRGVGAVCIKAQKRDLSFLSAYACEYWRNPMIEKRVVKYIKIQPSPETPSSDIGKFQIQFEDGSDITPAVFAEQDFVWPSYPLIVDNEEHATMFSRCWESYIHAQVSVAGQDG
jgi:hypothetical protein